MSLSVRGRVVLLALVLLLASPWLGTLGAPLAVALLAAVAGLTVADSPRPSTRVLLLAWAVPLLATAGSVGTVAYLLAVDADLLATFLVTFLLGVLVVLVWTAFGIAAVVGVLRRRFGRAAIAVEQ